MNYLVIFCAVCLTMISCGGDTVTASCTGQSSGANAYCREHTGLNETNAAALKTSCEVLSETYVEAACGTENSVGSCAAFTAASYEDTSKVVYYSPSFTAETANSTCTDGEVGGTYTASS